MNECGSSDARIDLASTRGLSLQLQLQACSHRERLKLWTPKYLEDHTVASTSCPKDSHHKLAVSPLTSCQLNQDKTLHVYHERQ